MSGTQDAAGETERRLAERYGRGGHRSVGRRAGAALVVLLVLALVGWWTWIAVIQSNPDVTWQLIGYDTAENSVDIRWVVDRDPQTPVDCVLRARDASGAEVGRDRATVATGGNDSVEMLATVRTSGPPVTGEVLSCLPLAD